MRPVADALLRACIFRVTSKDARTWGHVFARLRAARGQSPAAQAAALGVSESALAFACLCRLPGAGRRSDDLAAVAALVGIDVEVLDRLLADADG
jgi:hypothetical protein